jgi:hypothetical protein
MKSDSSSEPSLKDKCDNDSLLLSLILIATIEQRLQEIHKEQGENDEK